MLKKTYRVFAATVLSVACTGLGAVAHADSYPSKPIKLIVPFAPGGATDSVGRTVAEYLAKRLDSPVVVENRGGAGGTIGTATAARSAADGYTLLLGTAETFGIAENLFKDLPFDAGRDFTPVALATRIPSVFAVHPSVPANTIKEFVELAKKPDGKVNFGSPGVGTNIHLISELLKSRYKLEMTHVPYKGGGPAVADLLAGQIQIMPSAVAVVAPHIAAGKLRALAITSEQRSSLLPEVPTMAEAGVSDFVLGGWFGILAPTGTPQPILERLQKEMVSIGAEPDFREKMQRLGGEGDVIAGEAFEAFVASQTGRWKSIIEAAGISAAQ